MPPGTTRRYGLSGALLAEKTGRPIIPRVPLGGDFWRRNAFLKYPGTVQVRIGKPVYSNGRPPEEVEPGRSRGWIESADEGDQPRLRGE